MPLTKTPVGARVGALLSLDAVTAKLLGYGVYDGDFEPPFGPMQSPLDEYQKVLAEGKANGSIPQDYVWTNPRITLDDGRVVWGCQCWWGPEDQIKKKVEGRTIVNV